MQKHKKTLLIAILSSVFLGLYYLVDNELLTIDVDPVEVIDEGGPGENLAPMKVP